MLLALYPRCRSHALSSTWLSWGLRKMSSDAAQLNPYFIAPFTLNALLHGKPRPRIHILFGHMRSNLSDSDLHGLFEHKRLPGARLFSINEIALLSSPYSHTLPTPETFEIWMEHFGIQKDDLVVVYEKEGLFSAARVLWTFHVFGHNHVKILEGGLREWVALGLPTECGKLTVSPSSNRVSYEPEFQSTLYYSYQQVVENLGKAGKEYAQLVDARPASRFSAGSIPRSISIPFTTLLDPKAPHKFLSPSVLALLFSAYRFDDSSSKSILEDDRPIIASCDSGMTACILYLGLLAAKKKGSVGVFDGSWLEYRDRSNSTQS